MIKSLMDAHTMGIYGAASLLRQCGYSVEISPDYVEHAVDSITSENSQEIILKWIRSHQIAHLGISYRLDPEDAVTLVGRMVSMLKKNRLYEAEGSIVKTIHFAGLLPACKEIEKEYHGRIKTFCGGENAEESLLIMGVPEESIPKQIKDGCRYDKELLRFGQNIINKGEYSHIRPLEHNHYPEYGTDRDNLLLRLTHNFKGGFQPLIRAHSGPYSSDMTRQQCLHEFQAWCEQLASAGYLDILSIGSSQLSQSNFGENWAGKVNGGGVPVNSPQEYQNIWLSARPMLVRTYSGTKNVPSLAEIYEQTIHIAWHALSLWWFDELDGRGPNSLYRNLQEHIETMRYAAKTEKPVETNVPHHFAFRGCDDVTFIVSGFLAAKMSKKCGVQTFVLQNMLNTPRSTWGIQDLAKGRTLLKLVKELEDKRFRVLLQTRAGLDYFKPDLDEAKVQLAAVTAMMDDLDPQNRYSPDIIHVVSYSEALFLATPDILNDSIRITRYALNEYRKMKKAGEAPDVMTDDIVKRTHSLEQKARAVIQAMEEYIPNLYSPKGLYLAFTAGWLPVPELWSDSQEFRFAKAWGTISVDGEKHLTNGGVLLSTDARINRCVSNLSEAMRIFHYKYRE